MTTAAAPRAASALDALIPEARMIEVDSVELPLSAERAWERVRHLDLADARIARALFAVRTLTERFGAGAPEPLSLRLDDVRSSEEKPGFQVLVEDAPRELVVGGIGKVWHLDIPFVHVPDAQAYTAFSEPGYVKVAWALRVEPLTPTQCRVSTDVRVGATDDASWRRFEVYFLAIGIGSRWIRRSLLAALGREHGTLHDQEREMTLPGDELLPDAGVQVTQAITVHGSPEEIWPWLVQMGCRRAGYYSIDVLDNGGRRSAREIHPEWQTLAVGDVLPATPTGDDGFEVLRVEPPTALVLGGLFDGDQNRQIPFASARPVAFWQVTWAFTLLPREDGTTRLVARARAAFPPGGHLHRAAWIAPVHRVMQAAQLRHLAARVEGRVHDDDWREVLAGFGGAARMAAALATPFRRQHRAHSGVDPQRAARTFPGDALVPQPLWGWTHGIEVDAPADEVWPWVAQIGADRGGFYSYQWLENVAGCGVRNAETVHREWAVTGADALRLHPSVPPLPVVEIEPGHHMVVHGAPDAEAVREGRPWVNASWLFLVEPLGPARCRVISRYRCATSDDRATRLSMGPALIEPIGGVMDTRMLRGIRERAEAAQREATGRGVPEVVTL